MLASNRPSDCWHRKDELEETIRHFLRHREVKTFAKRGLTKAHAKDVDKGLSLGLPVVNYTSNRETKDFIVQQAKKAAPDVREKSGVWYRLNRWREDQITRGKQPTYGDLVRQYIALNRMERFEKIPYVCYINFVAEFLATEKGGTRADAIAAWGTLKAMDAPKTYTSWVNARAKRNPGAR